jgi:transcription termination factor Rho
VTDTTTLEAAPTRRSGSLTAMKLAELQGLASSMGITGTAKMRKGDLVDAIKTRQNGGGSSLPQQPPLRRARSVRRAAPSAARHLAGGRTRESAEMSRPQAREETSSDSAAASGTATASVRSVPPRP